LSRRYVSADDIYMKTRMFQIYLTDEMVDPSGKFTNGGEKNVTFCAIYI